MTSRPASQPPSPSNSDVPYERERTSLGERFRSTSVYRDATEGFFNKSKNSSSSTPQAITSDYFDASAAAGVPSSGSGGACSALPSTASADLANATIFLENTRFMETTYDADRKRQYQALVRRFMNQLLYGCDRENECTVPTCWTARKRLAGLNPSGGGVGKGRKFTVLSARIIACHMASRENPYEGLCSGRPVSVGLTLDGKRKPNTGKGKLKAPKPLGLGDSWRGDVGQGKENDDDDDDEDEDDEKRMALQAASPIAVQMEDYQKICKGPQ
ncbi:hypothetical protein DFH27DRAFT_599134 [Peziza echinospora]|nr:hypothetical protein DFH27DRAFT_599134 [Peziza echinospora]